MTNYYTSAYKLHGTKNTNIIKQNIKTGKEKRKSLQNFLNQIIKIKHIKKLNTLHKYETCIDYKIVIIIINEIFILERTNAT